MQSASELVERGRGEADGAIDIVFQDVVYSVEVASEEGDSACFGKTTRRVLLDGVTGFVPAGTVTAIMGASGAGKTTLLNVIACRVPQNGLQGTVRVNGKPYDFDNFGDFGNYVMQGDVLMQTLTVRETLEFAAELKLGGSKQAKKARVAELSRALKLENCLDVVVGGVIMKGISGGERKRTSIAFELISDPRVIILDEPTSGLDSLTSFVIVRYLHELAHSQGKTVLMTIHQPNSQTFALFDRLMLMVEGRFIYQGASSSAIGYFGDNFGLRCPQFHNPPDYFMSIMHHQDEQNKLRFQKYFQNYTIHFAGQVEQQIKANRIGEIERRKVEVSLGSAYSALLYRDFINIIRNPLLIKARFFQTIFMAIYAGGLFFGVGRNYETQAGWMGLMGFSFFLGANSLMMATGPVAIVFPSERNVFLKEYGAKMYGVGAYYLSRNIIELPYSFLFPVIQSLVFYWMIGLKQTAGQFFTFFLTLYLISFNGSSMGLLIGSIARDAKSVGALLLMFIFPFILFSGMFKNLGNLPVWIGWFQFLSPIRYTFSAFMQNQIPVETYSKVSYLNFDAELWPTIGYLAILGFGYRVLAYFLLWFFRGKLQ